MQHVKFLLAKPFFIWLHYSTSDNKTQDKGCAVFAASGAASRMNFCGHSVSAAAIAPIQLLYLFIVPGAARGKNHTRKHSNSRKNCAFTSRGKIADAIDFSFELEYNVSVFQKFAFVQNPEFFVKIHAKADFCFHDSMCNFVKYPQAIRHIIQKST